MAIAYTIHGQHFELNKSIKHFAQETLYEPLSRIYRKAGAQLDVELRDLRGGMKEGVDKECRAILRIPNGPQFVITEVTDEMRKSIYQAKKRLLRRVRSFAEQRQQGARRPARFSAASHAGDGGLMAGLQGMI